MVRNFFGKCIRAKRSQKRSKTVPVTFTARMGASRDGFQFAQQLQKIQLLTDPIGSECSPNLGFTTLRVHSIQGFSGSNFCRLVERIRAWDRLQRSDKILELSAVTHECVHFGFTRDCRRRTTLLTTRFGLPRSCAGSQLACHGRSLRVDRINHLTESGSVNSPSSVWAEVAPEHRD